MEKTTEGIFKYPNVVEILKSKRPPKGRPKPSDKPTSYKHGKIYFSAARKKLRVYTRAYDSIEKGIPADYKNKAGFGDAWGLACACIEADGRKANK